MLSGSTHTLVASNCAEGPASARRGRRNGGEPRNSASGPRVISLDQADGSSRALLQVALVSVHREAVAPSLRAQAGALVGHRSARDVGLNHDVGSTPNQHKMFDIVTADEDDISFVFRQPKEIRLSLPAWMNFRRGAI